MLRLTHARSRTMRELFADFNSLDEDPELGRFITLGAESQVEELRGLEDGEHVLLQDPGELEAEAYVVSRTVRNEKWWLGILTGKIEVIAQEPVRRDGAASVL
jgi:hypothetical protein